jgi:hypothetical protein
MWPMAVLASALVRPALVLTAAVPGGYGGGGGGGNGALPGGYGGKGGGSKGGGAGQAETEPYPPTTPSRVVAQRQTVPNLSAT